ncbi:hypothetical protein BV210_02395 [Halorientalis sp. IM1011]|uniref:hypothetical protein n=1 Tax=Halorientalis sp. IM1011 TaxID=1932360 RepID=UPI00097CC6D6|nr:hypothetical protein [Halorientalis sp. IM1011]AQL41634.1 hypothetical protein BV210_02395 [Halorientalis sp. IM1011]
MALNGIRTAMPNLSPFSRNDWWHVIVAVPLLSAGELVFHGVGGPQALGELVGSTSVIFHTVDVSSFLFRLFVVTLPIAFAYDSSFVRNLGDEWEPSSQVWAIGGIVTIIATFTQSGVIGIGIVNALCLWYLYRRYSSVGIPATRMD